MTRQDRLVEAVAVVDDDGVELEAPCRFLRHVLDSGCSPNTALAYGYDLRCFFEFLDERGVSWREFRPAVALELLGWLRKRPSRRAAQRLGLAATARGGRLLAPATVARVLAAVSSFYEWASAAELFTGENPMQTRPHWAAGMVSDRRRPFTGDASRQRPIRRQVRVRQPIRLPRPMTAADVTALLESVTNLRDLAVLTGDVGCVRATTRCDRFLIWEDLRAWSGAV